MAKSFERQAANFSLPDTRIVPPKSPPMNRTVRFNLPDVVQCTLPRAYSFRTYKLEMQFWEERREARAQHQLNHPQPQKSQQP